MAAVGAEKLDFLVPQLLLVAVKFPLALGASHPKDCCHEFSSSWPQWLGSLLNSAGGMKSSSRDLFRSFWKRSCRLFSPLAAVVCIISIMEEKVLKAGGPSRVRLSLFVFLLDPKAAAEVER